MAVSVIPYGPEHEAGVAQFSAHASRSRVNRVPASRAVRPPTLGKCGAPDPIRRA